MTSMFLSQFHALSKNLYESLHSSIDNAVATRISPMISKTLTIRGPVAEKIRIQLANIYENEVPSFQERPDAEQLHFPVSSTASALLRQLVRLQNMFEGDLTVSPLYLSSNRNSFDLAAYVVRFQF